MKELKIKRSRNMNDKKILVCSTSGEENGMYSYEMGAIVTNAPELAEAEFLPLTKLHWSVAFDTEIAVIFDRTTCEHDHLTLDPNLINRLLIYDQKVGRKVFLLTRSGRLDRTLGVYKLFTISNQCLVEHCFIQEAYYTYKKFGYFRTTKEQHEGQMREISFDSVDWEELYRVITY